MSNHGIRQITLYWNLFSPTLFMHKKCQQRPFFTPYIYSNISNFAGNE